MQRERDCQVLPLSQWYKYKSSDLALAVLWYTCSFHVSNGLDNHLNDMDDLRIIKGVLANMYMEWLKITKGQKLPASALGIECGIKKMKKNKKNNKRILCLTYQISSLFGSNCT